MWCTLSVPPPSFLSPPPPSLSLSLSPSPPSFSVCVCVKFWACVAGKTSPEAVTLRTACQLNLSSCYLNLGDYSKCIDETSQIIAEDPMSMKALYRRGQALYGLNRYKEAVPVGVHSPSALFLCWFPLHFSFRLPCSLCLAPGMTARARESDREKGRDL
jgi:hypothetical protein